MLTPFIIPATLGRFSGIGTTQAAKQSSSSGQWIAPAGIIANDLLVTFEYAYGGDDPAPIPNDDTPTGFTKITTASRNRRRWSLFYKLAVGNESGTDISGLSKTDSTGNVDRLLLKFRGAGGTGIISTVTVHSPQQEDTDQNPALQTIPAATGPAPLIVIGCASSGNSSNNPNATFNPVADQVYTNDQEEFFSKVYITSPQNVSFDMGDQGGDNCLLSCYLSLT